MRSLAILRTAIRTVPGKLRALPAARVAHPPAPGKWSGRQELGHLLDSAANNHQRIVRAQLDEQPAMPGYDGDRWVHLHGYARRDWAELIEIWASANRQLVAAAEAATETALMRTCTIAGSEPLTIAFVLDDYVQHMLHHLEHIGVDLKDLAAETENGSRA